MFNLFWIKYRYFSGRLKGEFYRWLIILCGGKCGTGLWVGKGVIWKYAPHHGIDISSNVYFGENTLIDVPINGRIRIGERVKFTYGCVISANVRVVIGDFTLLGEYCSVRDSDHGMKLGVMIYEQEMLLGQVNIGKDCWLGRNVAILRDSDIGDGVVIGAQSLVSKQKLLPMAVYVGCPARSVKIRT